MNPLEPTPPSRRVLLIHLFRRVVKPVTRERRAEVTIQLRDASSPDFDFFLLVVLSSIIATSGLLTNSPAVIIGAMLVAPLMSPILGLGLASLTGDATLTSSPTATLTSTPSATPVPPTFTPTPSIARMTNTLDLLQSPGGPSIGRLRTGDYVTVLYGTRVFDGLVWLEVMDKDGRLGWIPQINISVVTLTPTVTAAP
jgi:hypothetical protein